MPLSAKVILIGAGNHARVVLDCLGGGAYGFIDNKIEEFCGLKKFDDLNPGYKAIISFGAAKTEVLQRRHQVFLDYKAKSVRFASAIHKSAAVANDAIIGEGSMVGPGAIINARATIGANVIINSGAIIEHDVAIGDGSHIAPGAIILGTATVGKTVMIGAGAVILPEARVPDAALIKALSRFPR